MTKRTIEDLNLLDDFLFQETISRAGDGLLPQVDAEITDTEPAITGQSPDIYDMEPNNNYERSSLPRRTRYYNALIDSKLLDAGTDYANLRNVVIIMILPYDPFGMDRMIYTIRNQCIEDNRVIYNDGVQKIFLYTKGTEGNPSQELRAMLQYMETSTDDYVTNQSIATIHKIVTQIKRDKEVGIEYMKSWEIEQMIREKATREGHEEGFRQGVEEGIEQGIEKGIEQGIEQGIEKGIEQGIEQGIEKGIEQGIEQGIKVFIEDNLEEKISEEKILLKLQKRFEFTEEKAAKYLEKYGKK